MRNVHTSYAGYDSNMQQQGQQREEGDVEDEEEEGAFDDYPVVARLLIDRTFRLIQSAASHDTIEKVRRGGSAEGAASGGEGAAGGGRLLWEGVVVCSVGKGCLFVWGRLRQPQNSLTLLLSPLPLSASSLGVFIALSPHTPPYTVTSLAAH